jgi:hypothetical protein
MVTINYEGRFGNSLFKFFVARIISEKFKIFISNPLDTKISQDFQNGTIVDIDNPIIMDEFYQDRETIAVFEKNRHMFIPIEEKREGVFCHVRLGDLFMPHSKEGNRFLPMEYYRKALEGSNGGYISSDSPDDAGVKALAEEFNLEIYNDTPENTIIFAASFDKKVLSLGTFSWWIGFLGNQNNVICANPNDYPIWHGDIFPVKGWNTLQKDAY